MLDLTVEREGRGDYAGIARWEILRDTGALEVRMADGTTSNPLVDGSTVVISGSGLLNLRHEGNNIETYQRITTFQTNIEANPGYSGTQANILATDPDTGFFVLGPVHCGIGGGIDDYLRGEALQRRMTWLKSRSNVNAKPG